MSRLPQAHPGTPEAAGPGTETEAGGVVYGQPGNPRIGLIPRPSPEERAAAVALPGRCVNCDGLPASLLQRLSGIAQRAGYPPTSCWWCGHTPADLLAELQQLAARKAGAPR
jgi:hypothetical protein